MQIRNGAQYLKPKPAIAQTSVTAGGSGDNTEITGSKIDRLNYQSGLLTIHSNASIDDTETLSYSVDIQDSADGTTWNTAVELQATTVVYTASGSTSNVVTDTPLVIELAGYERYVRFNITPDLSASGTDTATINASCILTDNKEAPEGLTFTTIVVD